MPMAMNQEDVAMFTQEDSIVENTKQQVLENFWRVKKQNYIESLAEVDREDF